jgi:hypothetical protein
MNSDDDERSERDETDDSGEDSGDDDDDDVDDDNDDDSPLGSDDEEIKEEIVEKFILTFHNGDYDDEFDDALDLDQSVTIPAQPTQASYNKPHNWRERNQIGLEKVKRQLQSCIHSVKTVNLKLTHNTYGNQLMDGKEPIVWHEPILDEYWDQLENEIDRNCQLHIVDDISDINIENVEMKKERLDALVSILISGRAINSSKHVRFTNANLCGEGIISLSKLVDLSSNLQKFCLHHNQIDNIESARCLSRSLKSHTRIRELHLPHCDLGSTPEILLVVLQSDINYINLNNNNIDSLGAVKIAEYLESDPPIRCIELDHNRLNDDDAILISHALKRNTNLKTIHLRSNNLSSIGVKALLTCVFDSLSLNSISQSNHTLEWLVLFADINMPIQRLVSCIDILLELDWTEKILLTLQDKNSLLQYLANVPVGLIPEVLAFPLRQVDNQSRHKHLNILYSTMRWWNMPMLYSYHHCCVKSDAKRKRDVRDC